MSGEEPENKEAEPEQPGGAAPIVVNSEDQTEPSQPQADISKPPSEIRAWVQKLREPLTVVTLLLFFATLGLYLSTRDLVHDAEKTAERQLRAYVLVKTDGALMLNALRRTDDHHVIWEFGTIAENTGITPAFRVEFFSNHRFVRVHDFRKRVLRPPDFTRLETPVPFDIGGHQPIKGPIFQVGGEGLNLVKEGRFKWTIFAAIAYKDIFGKDRLTQYCGVVHLTGGIDYDAGQYSASGQAVASCEKYNCTDNYCGPSERFKLPKFADPTP